MSDEIEETQEIEDTEDGTEEAEPVEEPAPHQVDEEPSTLSVVLTLEAAEKKVEGLSAIVQEKREVLATIETSIAAEQATLSRIDQLDQLALADVQLMENAKRRVRKFEVERSAALSNLEAASAELSAASKALKLAQVREAEARLRRLANSVGATILVFSRHLRSLCAEVLSAADEVQSSAPFGYRFKAPCGFPFRSPMSRVLPPLPTPGYPRSPAREAMELLTWLAQEPCRMVAGNAEIEKRWVSASPILPQEEPDATPN